MHSARKGSASWTFACLIAAAVAICIRGGWNLGGVLPVYVTMDEAGDQKVGRVLCGLKTKELTFGSLPSRFKDAKTIEFNKIIPDYDTLPVNFQEVMPLLIASLIYHLEKLIQDLPQTHPLFMSRFWTETYRTEITNEILPLCLYQ